MILDYARFIGEVESIGVMSMSEFARGFPSLEAMTTGAQWHTGDIDTDPWQWKDRAASEHRLAFGCLLGGHKGFVSREMYPLFFAACRPLRSLDERYMRGEVAQDVKKVFALLRDGAELSTSDIRSAMRVTKKQGASRVDGAILELSRQYLITVTGNRRKISQDGRAYGWPSNTYGLAEIWAGDWLSGPRMPKADAREAILARCDGWGTGVDIDQLEKKLFSKLPQ